MGTNASFPPYEFTDDEGKIIGIDAYHGIWNILVSIGGACIVIWLVRKFAK